MKNFILRESFREKKKFIIYGLFNFIITNIFLQIMLLYFDTYFSTLISQIININIGFIIYGKKVFKVKKLKLKTAFNYIILAILLWLSNSILINYLFSIGINKNLAALFIVPILVVFSFYGQKYFVFKS